MLIISVIIDDTFVLRGSRNNGLVITKVRNKYFGFKSIG
jgi:hypothetical protein